MISRSLKCGLALSCGLLAISANAATLEKRANRPFADADHVVYSLAGGVGGKSLLPGGGVVNRGPVIANPKVVFIFWGPSFNDPASPDYAYARELQADRNQFGSTPEWKTIQQYGVTWPVNLGSGTPDWFDTTMPPTNVTDATVQAELNRYFSGGHGAYNSSTIYEVVTPSGHYSSSGSSTSCGGPSLAYCAYHGSYISGTNTVKYSIQPYPSCGGCKVSGWTDAQNEEHFFCHETREAAVNPSGGSWNGTTYDGPDDKCAWFPAPFIGTGGYGYQYEWSNADNACIKTK